VGGFLVGCMDGFVGRCLVDVWVDVSVRVLFGGLMDGCVGTWLVILWMDVSVGGWCLMGV